MLPVQHGVGRQEDIQRAADIRVGDTRFPQYQGHAHEQQYPDRATRWRNVPPAQREDAGCRRQKHSVVEELCCYGAVHGKAESVKHLGQKGKIRMRGKRNVEYPVRSKVHLRYSQVVGQTIPICCGRGRQRGNQRERGENGCGQDYQPIEGSHLPCSGAPNCVNELGNQDS